LRAPQVYAVKVVGALALNDGGEADWKLLAIRIDDPLAAQVDGALCERVRVRASCISMRACLPPGSPSLHELLGATLRDMRCD